MINDDDAANDDAQSRLKKKSSSMVNVLKLGLFVSGEYANKRKHLNFLINLIVISSFAINFSTMINFVVTTEDQNLRIECLGISLAVTLTLFLFILIKTHKSSIYSIIRYSISNTNVSSTKVASKKFAYVISWIIFTFVLLYTPYVFSPLVVLYISDVTLGDPVVLPFLAKFPWQIETIFDYYFTYLVQLLVFFYPMLMYCMSSMIILSIHFIYQTELEILLKAIRKLHPSGVSMAHGMTASNTIGNTRWKYYAVATGLKSGQSELQQRRIYDERMLSGFTDIIVRYQLIMKRIKEVKVMVNRFITAALLYLLLTTVWSAVNLITTKSFILQKLRSISHITAIMLHTYIVCYVAEHLNGVNDKVRNDIYDMPWHAQSLKLRKMTLMFMCHTQFSVRVKAFDMYLVDFNFMLKVINTIYSALNVYRRMFIKHH